MKLRIFFLMTGLLFASVLHAAEKPYHIVQHGETLSQIARHNILGKLYGKEGALEKILAFNPGLTDPDQISIGQRIVLFQPEPLAEKSARTPASDEVAAEKQELPDSEKGLISRLSAEAGFSYFRIDSQDKATHASSTFLSRLSPEVHLTWELDWSEKWTSRLRFSYAAENISNDTSVSPRALRDASGARYGMEAGAIRSWSSFSRTGLLLGFKEQIFTHAPDSSTVAIDRVGEPSLKVSQELDLLHVKTATLGAALSGEAIFSGHGPGYSTETGYGAEATVYLRHELAHVSIQGSINFGLVHQNSSIAEQSESHLGAVLGLAWRFGE